MRRRDRRGVALMLVLWLIIVLGVVATGIAAASHADSTLTWNLRARTTARYAAESGIAVATRQLETLLVEAPATEERARIFRDVDRQVADLRDVSVGSGRFGIAVVDLNARLDVNHSDAEMLRAFFAQFTDGAHAERAAAGLSDWVDADDLTRPGGAESREYLAAGSPYLPRNAPLDRLDDLAHVLAVGDSLAAAIAPYVTVDGDGLVNLNAVKEPVLAALPGIGAAPARALIARRMAGETFTSLDDLRSIGPAFPRLAVIPSRLLIVSRGWLAGHALTHEIQAVYGIAGSRLYLLTWRERDL